MVVVPVTEPSELIIMLPVVCDSTGVLIIAYNEVKIRMNVIFNRLFIDALSFWCYDLMAIGVFIKLS